MNRYNQTAMQAHPLQQPAILENPAAWMERLRTWMATAGSRWAEALESYPFVRNENCPCAQPRQLLLTRLAVVTTAGAYLPGEQPPFEESGRDLSLRTIPAEVDLSDVAFTPSLGTDPPADRDPQVLLPLYHLDDMIGAGIFEEAAPEVISLHGRILDACKVVEELAPAVLREVERQGATAALILPARRLDHQTAALLARMLEGSGIATVVPSVFREVVRAVRAPRILATGGQEGALFGAPGQAAEQREVLQRALRMFTEQGPADVAMPQGTQV